MGSHNPGRFRREGREAFEPGVNPMDINPYTSGSFWDKSNSPHWLEGWEEARKAYEADLENFEENYWVTARYPDDTEDMVGEISLRRINSCHDMPIELEIDGVVYKPEF